MSAVDASVLGGRLSRVLGDPAQRTKQRLLVPYTPRDISQQSGSPSNPYGSWAKFEVGSGTVVAEPGRQFTVKDRGMALGWVFSAPSGRTANGDLNGAWWKTQFAGDVLGLGFWRRAGSAMPDTMGVDVRIDGRMYRLDNLKNRTIDGILPSYGDASGYVLVDDDLPSRADSRLHQLEVALFGSPTSGDTTRTLYLTNLVVDQVSGGYPEPLKTGVIIDVIDVPTSAASIPVTQTGLSAEVAIRAITKLRYTCASGGTPRIVTVNYNGGNGAKKIMDQSIAAGTSVELDFGPLGIVPPAQGGTRFQHVADGAGITCAIEGIV